MDRLKLLTFAYDQAQGNVMILSISDEESLDLRRIALTLYLAEEYPPGNGSMRERLRRIALTQSGYLTTHAQQICAPWFT